MNKQIIRGTILALLAGTCWGFSGTVGQYLFMKKNIDAGWLTVIRMVASGIIILLFAGIKKRETLIAIWKKKETAVRLILFSLLGLMAVQFTYMQAIKYSNAGTATAIQYVGEALVLIVTCITVKRLPKIPELLGLFLALTGIFLLATHGNIGSMVLSTKGLLWGLGAAVSLMLYTLLPSRLIQQFGSGTVTGYGMFIGGIVLALLVKPWKIKVTADNAVIIGMITIILIGTVLAFTAFLQSTVDLGGVKAGLLAASETIAAPFFSALWLHTRFEGMDYVGLACILGMVVLLALPDLLRERRA